VTLSRGPQHLSQEDKPGGISRHRAPMIVVHDHRERNHQGLGNELVDGIGIQPRSGRVRRRQRIGGFLCYDYRAA
jgi:hypothetical protein